MASWTVGWGSGGATALVRARGQQRPLHTVPPQGPSARPATTRGAKAVARSLRDHGPSGLPPDAGLPMSLFHPYERLPPDGSTLMRDDEMCKPEEMLCKTPTHTYEAVCSSCSGTGFSRGTARNRHGGGRGGLSTCIACHGLGFVRHTTARFYPGDPNHLTIGRSAPPPPKRRSPLFERRTRAAPPPPQQQQQQQQQQAGQREAVQQGTAAEGMAPPPPPPPPPAQQQAPVQRPAAGGQAAAAPPPMAPQARFQAQAS